MELRPMNLNDLAKSNKSIRNLNSKVFIEGQTMQALALVVGVSSGLTKKEEGFYTFMVKDENAKVFPARLFNVMDFVDSGLIASSLNSKPVEITFIPQIFNGSWSLIVKDIQLHDGVFDYESFLGKIRTDSSYVDSKYNVAFPDEVSNPEYAIASFLEICGGRCGGFLRLMNNCAHDVENLLDSLDYTKQEVYQVFFCTFDCYYELLKQKKQYSILNPTELLNVLARMDARTKNLNMHLQIMDSCRAILGLGAPSDVLAHVIHNYIQTEEKNLELIELHSVMARGASKQLSQGKVLVRY